MNLYVTYHASAPNGSGWGSIELTGMELPRNSADLAAMRQRILENPEIIAAQITDVVLLNWMKLEGDVIKPETTIFLIYGSDTDGESLDLVVEANSKEQAEELWRAWADENGFAPDEKDYAIYMLPAKRNTPCVLEWGDQAGVVNVKESRH